MLEIYTNSHSDMQFDKKCIYKHNRNNINSIFVAISSKYNVLLIIIIIIIVIIVAVIIIIKSGGIMWREKIMGIDSKA